MPNRFVHDPQDTLDYAVDRSSWLQASETITVSTWSVPAGLTKGADSIAAGMTIVWISGGTDSTNYDLTNVVTTSLGRTDERTITIMVRNR